MFTRTPRVALTSRTSTAALALAVALTLPAAPAAARKPRQPVPGPRQARAAAVPRPDHEAALRAQPRPIRAARAPDPAGRQLHRQHRARARRAATACAAPATSCAPGSGSTAAGPGRIWRSTPAPGCSSSTCPASGATGSSTTRRGSSSGGSTPSAAATRRVKVGPKVSYCLRDLRRTRPGRRFSPRRLVYPACSVNSGQRRVTPGHVGRLVGHLPADLPRAVDRRDRLRGCFAFRHMADPRNGIYESKERNNSASVAVRLPFRPGNQRCPGVRSPAPDPTPAPPATPYPY